MSQNSAPACIVALRDRLFENIQTEPNLGRDFIPNELLKEIWDNNDLRTHVSKLGLGEWDFIQENLLKTLSILVWIRWDNWPSLARIIGNRTASDGTGDRLDKHLPYDKEALAGQDFPSSKSFAKEFHDTQYIFLPIVLIEGQDQEYSRERRLPFISESAIMGTGSYGTVTKVVVAKGQYMNAQGKPVPWEECLARKRLGFEDDFRKELHNLKTLKENQVHNDRVMVHSGSLIHGNDCNIFFKWADYNVQDLLSEKCDSITCPNITPLNLLMEASKLASALSFLHDQLDDIFCCHMDLKPDNVLVVRGNNAPVGEWMITDFGISVFKDSGSQKNNGLLSVRELEENIRHRTTTRTIPKRNPGPFQPPEVEWTSDANKVGRKGDVWSFGCVLTMVLAFALGRSQLVEEFNTIRGHESDPTDYFYHAVVVNNHWAQIPEVKPSIVNWLDALSGRYPDHATWIFKCVNLIKSTLSIKQSDRPDAVGVKGALREICSKIDSGIPLPPQPSPPPLEPDWSEIESKDTPSTPPLSRRSTNISLNHDREVFKESLKFEVPKGSLTTIFSPCGDKVVFLSQKSALVFCLQDGCNNSLNTPSTTSRFDIKGKWRRASISGPYLALRGGESNQVVALHCLDTMSPSAIDLAGKPTKLRLSDIVVSSSGDLVLRSDNDLHLRLSRTGKWVTKRIFRHSEENMSKEQLKAVIFGSNGEWLFAWSCGSGPNHWYIWKISDGNDLPTFRGFYDPANRFDKIEPLFVSSFTEPIVFTYEAHQHKASIMRRNMVRSKQILNIITAGMTPDADVIILLRRCTEKKVKDFYVIEMVELEEEKDGAYCFGREEELWNSKKSKLKVKDTPRPSIVIKQGDALSEFVILITSSNGQMEKITISRRIGSSDGQMEGINISG